MSDRELESNFNEGKRFFNIRNYDVAVEFFRECAENSGREDPYYNRYRSWLGLAQAFSGDMGGVVLCRVVAKEEGRDPEVLVNLAKAELTQRNRAKALDALQAARKINPHVPEIGELIARLDRRRKPAIPFLSRNNIVNRVIGKATYEFQRRRDLKKSPASES
ncbi:MAG TPA: hypothetical protein ENN42_06115 [Thioalkalivibrio sp.]|nr:hypothetical protein [Thioalkalivibrio sp.]